MTHPSERPHAPVIEFSVLGPQSENDRMLASVLGRENLIGYQSRLRVAGHDLHVVFFGGTLQVLGQHPDHVWLKPLSEESKAIHHEDNQLPDGLREKILDRLKRGNLQLKVDPRDPDMALHKERFPAYLKYLRQLTHPQP